MATIGRIRSARAAMKALLGALLQRCVLFPLAFLVPRRSRLWVFGAPQDGFSGNPKYLFLWMAEHRPDICSVWITGSRTTWAMLRDRGYRCELRWSRAGLLRAVTAGVHVVANDGSDTCLPCTGGARVLNTWHGVGIKNILRGATVGANAALYRKLWRPDVYLRSMHRFRRPALVLSTSPTMSEHFARCFDVPVQRCPQLGYPRLDPLVDPAFGELCRTFGDHDAYRRLCAGRTVYLYAPTLRDADADFFEEALPDLAELSEALRPSNGLLLLKLHPFTAAAVSTQVAELDNIAEWPAGLDLYPVLDRIDCLITDYSSLLYDYLAVAGSGVVVYAYDYQHYIATDRDLAFPLADNIIGRRADSFAELCETLRSGAALEDLPAAQLSVLRERFWGTREPVRSLASPAIANFVAGPRPKR